MNNFFFAALLFLAGCIPNKRGTFQICQLNTQDSIILFSYPEPVIKSKMNELYDSSKLILYSMQFNSPCVTYNESINVNQKKVLGFHRLEFDSIIIMGDTCQISFDFKNQEGFYCSGLLNNQSLYFSIAWNWKTKAIIAIIPWASTIIWQEINEKILKREELCKFVMNNTLTADPWLVAKLKQLNWACD